MRDEDLRSLGEFGLIGRFRGRQITGDRIEIGIGDDAAVIRMPGQRLVWTVDTLVDGTHFVLDRIDPVDLGYKSLAVNVSDIAAMGARPVAALVALVVPQDTPVHLLDGLWDGLSECAEASSCALAGGDTTSGPVLTVSVTVVGEPVSVVVTRAGAEPGELVCVTGAVGGSAAGLEVLAGGDAGVWGDGRRTSAEADLVRTHVRPVFRVAAGVAAAEAGASAMIDVSDGLVADLGHICEESGVGMRIDAGAVPLSAGAAELADRLGKDPVRWGLYGGEDYEIAMTVPEDRFDALRDAVRETGTVISVIGRTTEGAEVMVPGYDGPGGWDHFAATAGGPESGPDRGDAGTDTD